MLNKNKKRIFSFLLVCILTLSLPLAASAASAGAARAAHTLFTFTTIEVHDLLTTDDNGKQFKPSQFSGSTLYVDGLFYHSDLDATRNTIRTGACYWDGSYYTYVRGLAREGKSNVGIYGSVSMDYLYSNEYYCGFVKNLDSAGHIGEGTCRLYYVY